MLLLPVLRFPSSRSPPPQFLTSRGRIRCCAGGGGAASWCACVADAVRVLLLRFDKTHIARAEHYRSFVLSFRANNNNNTMRRRDDAGWWRKEMHVRRGMFIEDTFGQVRRHGNSACARVNALCACARVRVTLLCFVLYGGILRCVPRFVFGVCACACVTLLCNVLCA